MPLMDRIKIVDFLSQSFEEQLTLIKQIQAKREHSLAQSRLKPIRTKGKANTKAKKVKDPATAALAALKKLSPKARELLMERIKKGV